MNLGICLKLTSWVFFWVVEWGEEILVKQIFGEVVVVDEFNYEKHRIVYYIVLF